MSLLKPYLKKLRRVGVSLVPSKEEKRAGAYNSVSFSIAENVHAELADGRKLEDPLPVAVSQNLDAQEKNKNLRREGKRQVEQANKVQRLLRNLQVDTRFLQTFIYFDDNGRRVSPRASEGSLYDFIKKNYGKLTRQQIKNIFGQIVLGVMALHEKNVVHRDIKIENVLIHAKTKNKDEFSVRLGDLDTIAEVCTDGTFLGKKFRMIGGSLFPQELKPLICSDGENSEWIVNDETKKVYEKINHKAVDLFALASILKALIGAAQKGEISNHRNDDSLYDEPIFDLYYRMIDLIPEYRLTIQQVMEHAFFKERADKDFFQKLADKVEDLYLDGYYMLARRNDVFLLLTTDLKCIYDLTQKLDSQFNYFDHPDMSKQDIEMQLAAFNGMEKIFHALNQELDEKIKNCQSKKVIKCLQSLQRDVISKRADIHYLMTMKSMITDVA